MPYNYNRINSIFGGELTAPDMPDDLNIIDIMNQINPRIDQDNMLKRRQFEDDRAYNRQAHLSDVAASMQHPAPGFPSNEFTGMPHSNMRQPEHHIPLPQAQSRPNPIRQPINPVITDQMRRKIETPPVMQGHVFINKPISPIEQATLDFKGRELNQKGDIAANKLDVTKEGQNQRFELGQQRNDIADFKAKNPGMKFQISKGGNIIGFDPITGQGHDTGISSGTLSDADKIAITNTGDLAEIEARGNIQKDLQATKGTQALAQIGARGDVQKDIQGTKGTQALEQIGARTAGAKDIQGLKGDQSIEQILTRAQNRPESSMPPTQQRVAEANKARELANTRPELAKFLKQDQNGNYTITPPGGWSGPTLAQFAEINQILYPKSAAPTKVDTSPKTDVTATAPIKQYSASRNQTRISTDGGKTWKIVEGKQ